MLIVNNIHKISDRTILSYIPSNIRKLLSGTELDGVEEIRLRRGLPVSISMNNTCFFINQKGMLRTSSEHAVCASKNDIDEAVELVTASSLYAVSDEIKNGFVTVGGGHRVGICGRAVMKDGEISFIKDICGLNYRFAREVKGAADSIINEIAERNMINNTLIISPPQCGKTTILRDIARQLSYKNIKVSIVDERGEIAGMNNGVSGYDLGANTDVMDFCPKASGMLMMLRSMSPEVVITDEIGTKDDIEAIEKLINSGVRVVTSIHSGSREEILNRADTKRFYSLFDCYITLSRRNGAGTIEEIYKAV